MKYLDAEDRHFLRSWIWDETFPTTIRIRVDPVEGWVGEIGNVVIHGAGPADILDQLTRLARES